jgi:hypothetical protein
MKETPANLTITRNEVYVQHSEPEHKWQLWLKQPDPSVYRVQLVQWLDYWLDGQGIVEQIAWLEQ